MMIQKMYCFVVSLSTETFLNIDQFYLVTKPSSSLRTSCLSVHTRDDPDYVQNALHFDKVLRKM